MTPVQNNARERMLDGLRRHRQETVASIARRSRRVSLFKKLLPAAAVLLLVALAIAPGLRNGPNASRVTYHVSAVQGQAAASSMQGAQYHGIDQHGQPFTLTASAANEKGGDDVALTEPQGDLTQSTGAWLLLKSASGLFHQQSQTLNLQGNVTLYRNDGTMMTAPAADIDLKAGSAVSAAPVQAQGPFGSLRASHGFKLSDHGADILFNGPVTLLLNAGPAK